MSNERLEVLGGLPLFEPLSPDERERLAAGCRMRAFARGAALFREGERADGMHIVLRGVVKVVRFAPDGREMVLHLVRKGNTIGEAAMFQKGTFPASAVAGLSPTARRFRPRRVRLMYHARYTDSRIAK